MAGEAQVFELDVHGACFVNLLGMR